MRLLDIERAALWVCADPRRNVNEAPAEGVALLRERGLVNHRREVTGKGFCALVINNYPERNGRIRRGKADKGITL